MTSLTRHLLPTGGEELPVLAVPSFGLDDEDNPYTVNVRPLTVAQWGEIYRRGFNLQSSESDGKLVAVRRDEFDEVCFVAACCAVDDQGKLVFGRDRYEAYEMTRNLPRRHRDDLVAIHHLAMDLSGEEVPELDRIETDGESRLDHKVEKAAGN